MVISGQFIVVCLVFMAFIAMVLGFCKIYYDKKKRIEND